MVPEQRSDIYQSWTEIRVIELKGHRFYSNTAEKLCQQTCVQKCEHKTQPLRIKIRA